jgi:hypothetical protein
MYMSKLFKIGIPIIIVLLMLVVVGTGLVLAKEQNTSTVATNAVNDAGYSNGTWVGCDGYYWGQGGGYGRGEYEGNSGNYPPCHGYWQ